MRRMSATELADHLEDANPLLIDVREPWEFEICHIVGSVNIPMNQIPLQLHRLQEADESVVFCHHGIRSHHVIHYLEQHDIDSLINLDGGVDAWARAVDLDMPVY